MPKKDKTSSVTATLAQILTACTVVRKAIEETDLPHLSEDLLTIYVAIDELVELAVPTPSEGELQGIPKIALGTFTRLEFRHVYNPEWDYQPWFAGKAISAKGLIRRAVAVWKDFKDEPTPKLRDDLSRHVENCHTYADVIYQELINDRLEITELSSE